jgi:hypothetical protein
MQTSANPQRDLDTLTALNRDFTASVVVEVVRKDVQSHVRHDFVDLAVAETDIDFPAAPNP